MKEVTDFLVQPGNWLNPASIIQMLVAVTIVVGLLIALPDRATNSLMKQDRFGVFLILVGLLVAGIFLAPQVFTILVDIASSGYAVVFVIAFIMVMAGIIIVVRSSRNRPRIIHPNV